MHFSIRPFNVIEISHINASLLYYKQPVLVCWTEIYFMVFKLLFFDMDKSRNIYQM